jgi:hypothetical protein
MKAYLSGLVGLALLAVPATALAQSSPGGPEPIGCAPHKSYDRDYHEWVTVAPTSYQCESGYIKARNADTGREWRIDTLHGGAMTGVDEDGAKWRYDPQARQFINLATGHTCTHTEPRHVCAAEPS